MSSRLPTRSDTFFLAAINSATEGDIVTVCLMPTPRPANKLATRVLFVNIVRKSGPAKEKWFKSYPPQVIILGLVLHLCNIATHYDVNHLGIGKNSL